MLQAHQARHAIAAARHTALLQGLVDPGTAIALIAFAVDSGNLSGQLPIGLRSGARRSLAPRVVATAGARQDTTQHREAVLTGIIRDELVLHRTRRENTAKAFFKMSRSSVTSSRSRRSRASSLSASLSFPLPGKASLASSR